MTLRYYSEGAKVIDRRHGHESNPDNAARSYHLSGFSQMDACQGLVATNSTFALEHTVSSICKTSQCSACDETVSRHTGDDVISSIGGAT